MNAISRTESWYGVYRTCLPRVQSTGMTVTTRVFWNQAVPSSWLTNLVASRSIMVQEASKRQARMNTCMSGRLRDALDVQYDTALCPAQTLLDTHQSSQPTKNHKREARSDTSTSPDADGLGSICRTAGPTPTCLTTRSGSAVACASSSLTELHLTPSNLE